MNRATLFASADLSTTFLIELCRFRFVLCSLFFVLVLCFRVVLRQSIVVYFAWPRAKCAVLYMEAPGFGSQTASGLISQSALTNCTLCAEMSLVW